MKNLLFLLSTLLLVTLILFQGCRGKRNIEEELAKKIAEESCQEFSKVSNGLVGAIVSGAVSALSDGYVNDINTGSLGELPPHWCECYTYFVTKDLQEKFTRNELLELRRDKIKKMMVIEKIIEVRGEEMAQCIAEPFVAGASDYEDFSKTLDEKFKE